MSSIPSVSANAGLDGVVVAIPDIVEMLALFRLGMDLFLSSSGDRAWLVILS